MSWPFLEAWNRNIENVKKMLEETLKWKSVFKPEEIRWEEVVVEGETGKVYRANFHNREGRSVLILRPAMQDQEQMSWLIDFTGWSLSTSVPIKSAKETVNILQNHYPERLAMAFLHNPPRIFEVFWKLGGKAILRYDREEFSKQMAQDNLEALNLWGFDQRLKVISVPVQRWLWSLQVLQQPPVESVHTSSILPMLAAVRLQEKPCGIEATITRMR